MVPRAGRADGLAQVLHACRRLVHRLHLRGCPLCFGIDAYRQSDGHDHDSNQINSNPPITTAVTATRNGERRAPLRGHLGERPAGPHLPPPGHAQRGRLPGHRGAARVPEGQGPSLFVRSKESCVCCVWCARLTISRIIDRPIVRCLHSSHVTRRLTSLDRRSSPGTPPSTTGQSSSPPSTPWASTSSRCAANAVVLLCCTA